MSIQEVDQLIWQYVDGSISMQDKRVIEKMRKEDAQIEKRINEYFSIHDELSAMPLIEIDPVASEKIQKALYQQTQSNKINWRVLNTILIIAALTFLSGVYFFIIHFWDQPIGGATEHLVFQTSNWNLGELPSFDINYLWMYSVILMIIPVQMAVESVLQRSYVHKSLMNL